MFITKLVTNAGAFDIVGKNKDEVLADIEQSQEFYVVTKEVKASYKDKLCNDFITIYIKRDNMEILAIEEHRMEEIVEEEKPLKTKKK